MIEARRFNSSDAPRTVDTPARAVALEWCRMHAPGLRIQHGQEASAALFELDGKTIEIVDESPEHRDAIVRRVFVAIRDSRGEPVKNVSALVQARALEGRIVAARYAGQHQTADALERELLHLRAEAVRPRPRPKSAHEGVMPQQRGATRWKW